MLSKDTYITYYKSPLGWIELTCFQTGLGTIQFVKIPRKETSHNQILDLALEQIDEYFQGKRMDFDLPLSLQGTAFQKKVWEKLKNIPFGQTRTYGQLAADLGKPKAARAVGLACNQNSIPIIIPCHRLLGKNGHLVGYASGLWRKEWLLKHEGSIPSFL